MRKIQPSVRVDVDVRAIDALRSHGLRKKTAQHAEFTYEINHERAVKNSLL
jgi:hypothetical protein